jgi:hypothetical protein
MRLAASLRQAGVSVWLDAWELMPGDSVKERIAEATTSSDVLVVFLSRHSVNSPWLRRELTTAAASELRDRAVTLIPVLIEDCDIPPEFRGWRFVDLRGDLEGGTQRLVEQLTAVPTIDYTKLSWRAFESLVADLLVALGFEVQPVRFKGDSGVDLVVNYTSLDPFGSEKRETWFVETKFYHNQRVSVKSLHQLLGYLAAAPGAQKGLMVTNGQLTSAARDYLVDAQRKSGHEIRVLDGTELTSLISRHPQLVQRYFAEDAAS